MTFEEILDQATAMLQRRGRVAYRTLKLQFHLDEEQVEALKEDLLFAHPQVQDEGGRGLVWSEKTESAVALDTAPVPAWSPASYTPPHLAERIRAEQVTLESRSGTDGERKTITALFADLKGSTALIEGLDPEEARSIIDPALQLMMDAVHRYEGYVAQVLGDGIFALFGAPIAHEDHPQRALYAALRMQDEMRRYGDTLRQKGYPPLLMRVGVNTGEVVVRSIRKDDLHTDYVPVGHSTNLAARMEQLATPGSILITDYTRKLTEGYFAFKALGAAQIKGVEAPLQVYEVVGAGPLRTRLQVSATRGLTRFVGRQSEMEQLQRALGHTIAGHGQIVGVMGEPGLGKSRLFYEFKLLSRSGCLVLEAYSVSHGKASPYLPVIELLKSYFRIESSDDERTRREKVGGKVLMLDRSLEDTLPYLFALLGIEEQPSLLQQMDAQIRRRRTFEALKKLLLRESLNQPLILIFEDLHWIDTETQGFLDTLSEGVASARLLLLVNYRPEYRHEWGAKTYYTQLRLSPLGPAEAAELLSSLLGDDASLIPVKRLILEKTEGTPFFMEEVVQTLAEEGLVVGERGHYRLMHHAPTFHLPTTVHGVLAARIDRLAPDEKALLQQLAVIGRQFPASLLHHVIPQPEDELYRLLASLQRKEFLYEQPAFPEVEYFFKHALTQEVAYGTVLQERRKALHERTAQAMEALYHATLDEHYSELAHHYSRSSNIEKAIEYLHLAGQQAVQRSANAEAVRHLTKGLELLNTLPDTPERIQQELRLQIALGVPLTAIKGFSASEVASTYTRARDLCQQTGDTLQLSRVLWGLWVFYVTRAELGAARDLAEQFLSLARGVQDPALLMEAHFMLGSTLLWLGEMSLARAYLAQGSTLYDPQQHLPLALLYGSHHGVSCLTFLARALWHLGGPAQALQSNERALALATSLSHPFSLALVLSWAAALHQLRREAPATQERAEAALALTSEQGFAFFAAHGMVLRGWALVEQGQEREGVAQIRRGIAAYRATGAELERPHWSALLAEACGKVGQAEEGLSVLADALATVDEKGNRYYEAELCRLQGELTLKQSSTPELASPELASRVQQEAEACFLKAIEIARRQQAKSLELRAATSLARLWHQQGKRAEAQAVIRDLRLVQRRL